MRTARSSSRPGGSPPGAPLDKAPPGTGHPLGTRHHPPGTSTPREQAPPRTRHPPQDQAPPPRTRHPPCGQNHRRLWKYNLAPTSLWAVIIPMIPIQSYEATSKCCFNFAFTSVWMNHYVFSKKSVPFCRMAQTMLKVAFLRQRDTCRYYVRCSN